MPPSSRFTQWQRDYFEYQARQNYIRAERETEILIERTLAELRQLRSGHALGIDPDAT